MKKGIKISENELRKTIYESIMSALDNSIPEKLLYYPESGKLTGDIGYDFLDKNELGGSNSSVVDGIVEYLTYDYPSEKEEIYNDCVVVLYSGMNGEGPEKFYISSIDREFANEISIASRKMFGREIPVEIVGNAGLNEKQTIEINEGTLRQIVSESIRKTIIEGQMWNQSKFKTRGEEIKYFAKMDYDIESKAFEILGLIDDMYKSTNPLGSKDAEQYGEMYKHLIDFIFTLQRKTNDGTVPTRKYDDNWLKTQMFLGDRYDKYGV